MQETTPYDVMIIGAGASGLAGAISCGRQARASGLFGLKIAIIEQNNKIGRKLLATGNGRCNLSHTRSCGITAEKYYQSRTPKWFEGVLSQFNVADTCRFFEELGIHCVIKDDGRIYPYCREAASVVQALDREVKQLGIDVFCGCEAVGITKAEHFEITCRMQMQDSIDQTAFYARKVILSTGGKASPSLSSESAGYPLVLALGHSVTDLAPGIVHLTAAKDIHTTLKGIRWDVTASIFRGRSDNPADCMMSESGELLFTDFGLSGPVIFQLSRFTAAHAGADQLITIDFLPEFSAQHLSDMLPKRIRELKSESADLLLFGLLPYAVSRAITGRLFGISRRRTCSSISPPELAGLIRMVKAYPFTITGTTGWKNAQITMGGVNASEINPETMGSTICKGCYLTGELLDVDGACGGFNLQFAWASGYIAGKNAVIDILLDHK